jgi:hypothetical protein
MIRFYFILLFAVFGLHSPADAQAVDSLVVTLRDGTKITAALRDITKITFDSIKSSVADNATARTVLVTPVYSADAIRFDIATSHQSITGRIVDILGIPRRQLAAISTKGKAYITWDLKDDYGHLIEPGLYFFVARVGDQVSRTKVIITR